MRKTHRASCSRWFPGIDRAACIKPVNLDGSLLQVIELQGLHFRMGTSFGVLERALGLIMGFPWSCRLRDSELGRPCKAREGAGTDRATVRRLTRCLNIGRGSARARTERLGRVKRVRSAGVAKSQGVRPDKRKSIQLLNRLLRACRMDSANIAIFSRWRTEWI